MALGLEREQCSVGGKTGTWVQASNKPVVGVWVAISCRHVSLSRCWPYRCCRTVQRLAGRWSCTGGPPSAHTLCTSWTSMRTCMLGGSACSLSWSGKPPAVLCPALWGQPSADWQHLTSFGGSGVRWGGVLVPSISRCLFFQSRWWRAL